MTTQPKARPCLACGRSLADRHPNAKYCNGACLNRARKGYKLQWLYGITVEQYERMLTDQGGVCAICTRKPGRVRLSVDHDHTCCPGRGSCGKCVRGLLCKSCNYHVLGNVCQENKKGKAHAIEVLGRAQRYLDGGGFGALRT